MAELRRITVEDVRAALAALPGFVLATGVCYDPEARECCPQGALIVAKHPEKAGTGLGIEDIWRMSGNGIDYTFGVMDGFDGEGLQPDDDDEEYVLGHADGAAIRAAFGVLTAGEIEGRAIAEALA